MVWYTFFDQFNGWSIFQEDFDFAADLELSTDVAGSQGFAAIWHTHWLCGSLPDSWIAQNATKNIVLFKFVPVCAAFELWSANFANKQIIVSLN